MGILEVNNLKKSYQSGQESSDVLAGINMSVAKGEMVAVMGASGSGKTTLMNLLAGLWKADEGDIIINGVNLNEMSRSEVAVYRRRTLGIVFQDFNLIESLNIKENIYLPMILEKLPQEEQKERADKIVEVLGIQSLMEKEVTQISGGEKQRVAIARALVNQPVLILADEPTGNLDYKTSADVMDYFREVNQIFQTSLIIVTHDIFTAACCDRVILLEHGVTGKEVRKVDGSEAFQEQIIRMISSTFGKRHVQ